MNAALALNDDARMLLTLAALWIGLSVLIVLLYAALRLHVGGHDDEFAELHQHAHAMHALDPRRRS